MPGDTHPPFADPSTGFWKDNEAFDRRFSTYGPAIKSAVEQMIYMGHSTDWVINGQIGDNPEFDADSSADMENIYQTNSYSLLPNEQKAALMKEIIREMFRQIKDFQSRLSEEGSKKVERLKSSNFFESDYSRYNEIDDPWAGVDLSDVYPDWRDEGDLQAPKNPEDNSGEFPENGTYDFVIKQAINELKNLGQGPATIDFLMDFWNASRDPYFGPAIANTISEINPEYGVKKILEGIGTAEEEDQTRLLSLLYRMELGKVGISEQGVNYLGRIFEVGVNEGSVSRLTADGKVGVFNDLKQLIGFFKLEGADFTVEQQGAIKKQLEAITIDMLFIPRTDETREDIAEKEKLLAEFKQKYFQIYLEAFSKHDDKADFRFNNLSLPEQGFVLKFLSQHDEGDPRREEFFNFIVKFGENGLRAFRSIEFDPDAGEKILDLQANLSDQEAEILFTEYGKIYQIAEEVAIWVKKVLFTDADNLTAKDLLEVNILREQILRKAQDALLHPIEENSGTRFLPGRDRLFFMRNELEKVVSNEPTIDNFEMAQFILNRYFADNVPSGERLSLSEQVISDGLAKLYNNQEFSLRDYEGKTSDTSRSLSALLHEMNEMPAQEMTGDPEERLIYDIGAGDGRIAIPLALSGANVVGIDYSERMVADSRTRPIEFARTLRNGEDDHLADSARSAFDQNGLKITEEAIAKLPKKIDIRHGNFFDFDKEKFKTNFGERQPDAIVIMWHTLGFAGDLDGIRRVLKNAYGILRPGGRIFIEMPDRNFGGYARAIREFHETHPDKPFGSIQDAPSKSSNSPTEQNDELATWRYFPKNSEIEGALEETGFDPHVSHLGSYFVAAEAGENAKLLIKENMFIAEKPLDPIRQKKMLEWAQNVDKDQGQQEQLDRIRKEIRAA